MNYGLPYKGSKSRITKWLMPLLPEGEVFVDLMCGGCSVIGSTERTDSISATATVKRTEKLFVQSKFMNNYKSGIL